MKIKLTLIAAVSLLTCNTFTYGAVITDFGTSSFTVDAINTDFSTVNQSGSDIGLIGTDSSILVGTISGFDISGFSSFELTGAVTGTNPNSQFIFEFYDSGLNKSTYTAFTSSFGVTATAVVLNFSSSDVGFNPNDVIALQYSGAGSGSAINLNLSKLEAVPEPATWALLAGSLTTIVVLRRRRRP